MPGPENTPSPRRVPSGRKSETLRTYRVVSATGHISDNHVGDGQNLPVFRLLDEDGHSPGHQLTVVLYPLCPGDEFPIRVVSCSDQSQWSAAAPAQGPCPNLASWGLRRAPLLTKAAFSSLRHSPVSGHEINVVGGNQLFSNLFLMNQETPKDIVYDKDIICVFLHSDWVAMHHVLHTTAAGYNVGSYWSRAMVCA